MAFLTILFIVLCRIIKERENKHQNEDDNHGKNLHSLVVSIVTSLNKLVKFEVS